MNAYCLELKNVLRLDACYPIRSHCFCWVMFVRSQRIFLVLPLLNFILLYSFQVLVIINLVALIWVSLFIFRGKCLFSIDMILIAVMLNWNVFRLNLVKVKKYFYFSTIKFHSFYVQFRFWSSFAGISAVVSMGHICRQMPLI